LSSDDIKSEVIIYWLEKADESIEAARDEFKANRYTFAVNRAYYSCFYAFSAVLLKEGHKFSKHTGVRSALHHQFVKTGRIPIELGRFYDLLFDSRQKADYQELAQFKREEVEELLSNTAVFINKMKKLLNNS